MGNLLMLPHGNCSHSNTSTRHARHYQTNLKDVSWGFGVGLKYCWHSVHTENKRQSVQNGINVCMHVLAGNVFTVGHLNDRHTEGWPVSDWIIEVIQSGAQFASEYGIKSECYVHMHQTTRHNLLNSFIFCLPPSGESKELTLLFSILFSQNPCDLA